jgi:predicted transcriptional regulator
MTLQLTLSPELEERLRQEAERRGQPAEAVALRLLEEHLPPPLDERRAAAIALLRGWMAEDAQAGDLEGAEEFFRNLDAARTSNRPLFPPELKGITW